MSKESALAKAIGTTPAATTPVPVTVESTPAPTIAAPSSANEDPQIQALLKKEIRLTREQDALRKERLEWEAKVKQADELLAKGKLFDETLQKDATEALKLIGYTDTQIFNMIAQGSEPKEKTPEQIAREAALEEIKKDNDRKAEEAKTEGQKRNQELVKGFEKRIMDKIEASKDKLKFTAFMGEAGKDLVLETVTELLKKDPSKTPSQHLETALEDVEWYYKEQYTAMAALEKPAASVPPQEPTKEALPKPEVSPQKSKTLTNAAAPTVNALIARKETQEQKRSRLERALALGVHPSSLLQP